MDMTPAEEDLWTWTDKQGLEVLQSAFLKLELGMATSEEQIVMAEFMKKLRNLLREGSDAEI
jgi:hypothetical protein